MTFSFFDILSLSFDTLSLSRGWCCMTPEFQTNERTTARACFKKNSLLHISAERFPSSLL